MSKVTPMPGTSAEWSDSVVQILNEWLVRAENGELQGIALVGIPAVDEDACISQYHTGGKPFALVGGIEAIKHDIIHGHITGRNYN